MISGTINFSDCRTMNDVESAISEALSKITIGYTSGGDSNDDGGYNFRVNGEPEEEIASATNGENTRRAFIISKSGRKLYPKLLYVNVIGDDSISDTRCVLTDRYGNLTNFYEDGIRGVSIQDALDAKEEDEYFVHGYNGVFLQYEGNEVSWEDIPNDEIGSGAIRVYFTPGTYVSVKKSTLVLTGDDGEEAKVYVPEYDKTFTAVYVLDEEEDLYYYNAAEFDDED